MDKKHNLTTAILDAFEDGVYVMDGNLVVEYMNSAMVAEFGDGVGKKCHQLLNQSEDKCSWCLSDEVFAGKTVRREVYVPRVGRTYYLTETPFENEDGTLSKLSIYRDISNRKIQEELLRASEEEFKNLFEHVASGVFISSKEGKFLNANQALLDMLGYDNKEAFLNIDLPQDLYVRPGDRQTFQEMMERDGRVIDYEVEFKRKDGSTIPILLTGHARYDQQGNIIGYEGLNVDLTQRKLMERALRDTQEQLLQSEKLAAMGRLTSQIAHELNNPLYGIMNTLELLKTEIPADNKRRKILEMALSETIRLSDLLRKMLSFSKPDQEERHPVDINFVLDEILLLHEKQLKENDINIAATYAEGLRLVNASKNQLRQVFLNMVANARDAMSDGGTLSVATRGDSDTVYVEVTDTGTGIREEHLDKIFDSFFTTKGEVKGVGLGLSVCYGLIKDHGGDIEVKSQVGEGTAFTISLPVHTAAESGEDNSK